MNKSNHNSIILYQTDSGHTFGALTWIWPHLREAFPYLIRKTNLQFSPLGLPANQPANQHLHTGYGYGGQIYVNVNRKCSSTVEMWMSLKTLLLRHQIGRPAKQWQTCHHSMRNWLTDGLAGRLTEELLLAVTNLTKYIVAEDSNNSNNGTSLANKLLPKSGLQYQKKKIMLEESESKKIHQNSPKKYECHDTISHGWCLCLCRRCKKK